MKNNENHTNNTNKTNKKINDVPDYTIKTIMSDNLTENDKEIFNMFQQIQNTNMLEGNTYCDSSLKIPSIVNFNSDNTNNEKSKNVKKINEFMDEMKNTNTKISKKQQKLNNKKFVELFNKL